MVLIQHLCYKRNYKSYIFFEPYKLYKFILAFRIQLIINLYSLITFLLIRLHNTYNPSYELIWFQLLFFSGSYTVFIISYMNLYGLK
ncbi:hypothetical protein SAMN05216297_102408 [Flavobacterium phragmitis]|uniref:Uncharacterized protein n=1 Tax=Flavobacterium phragmitis TaxID=739143 RepID=A0A1I1MLT5_9FLAO|nr:hypothetical protein SAMN05216297_102408 [Flavobacterium phragmitis]